MGRFGRAVSVWDWDPDRFGSNTNSRRLPCLAGYSPGIGPTTRMDEGMMRFR